MTARAPGAVLALGAAALAALLGGILALLAAKAGPLALVLPGLLVASIALAFVPRATATIAVVAVAVLEADPAGFLGGYTARYYETLPALPVRPHEVLLGIAAAGVALERSRTRKPVATPGALTLPLLTLAVAAVCGVVVGRAADASAIDLLNGLRSVLTLALVPFLVVNLIETRRDLEWVLGAAVAVVAVKTAFGGFAWLIGAGRVIEGTVLTYYAPLANLLLMAYVLGVLAARLRGARLPRFVLWLAPFALAVLILSFRRNFWIALVLGAVLVVLVAVGARGRLLLVPAGVLIADLAVLRADGAERLPERQPGRAARAVADAEQGPGQRAGPLPARRAAQRAGRDRAPSRARHRPRRALDGALPARAGAAGRAPVHARAGVLVLAQARAARRDRLPVDRWSPRVRTGLRVWRTDLRPPRSRAPGSGSRPRWSGSPSPRRPAPSPAWSRARPCCWR